MPLKILHAIRSVNPAGGGPIEGLKQLAAVNLSRGHQIEVLSLDSPDAPWVQNCPLKVYAVGPASGSYGYSARFVPWLRTNLDSYDAVVVDGIWQYHAFGVWRTLRKTSTPYFVFTHGMLDPWFKKTYPLKHLKKWLYWPWADYRVLRDAAAVLFTCEEERLLARQSFWLYRCKEKVVNLGSSGPPPGDAETRRRLFGERWPETGGKRCLLYLGRVHVKKGPDLLLRAFAHELSQLSSNEAAARHLIMAGPADNAYGAEMQELATTLGLAGKVTWTGMITGDLKWGAYYQSEVFLLPSHQENFGIVVAEALACARPVLISNKINIWREIEADRAGFVETDDLPGTIRLLQRWRELSPPARTEMSARASACFRQRFHIDQSARNLIAVIEQAVQKSAGG
jgi:glycosyltransferase involved in cell wall biosynthesis